MAFLSGVLTFIIYVSLIPKLDDIRDIIGDEGWIALQFGCGWAYYIDGTIH